MTKKSKAAEKPAEAPSAAQIVNAPTVTPTPQQVAQLEAFLGGDVADPSPMAEDAAAEEQIAFIIDVSFHATIDGDAFDSTTTFAAPPALDVLRDRVRTQLAAFGKRITELARAYREQGRGVVLAAPSIRFVVEGSKVQGSVRSEQGSTGEALSAERLEPMVLLAAETALELLA